MFAKRKSIYRERNIMFFGNYNLGPFNIYTIDHPDLTVSNFMGRVKLLFLVHVFPIKTYV